MEIHEVKSMLCPGSDSKGKYVGAEENFVSDAEVADAAVSWSHQTGVLQSFASSVEYHGCSSKLSLKYENVKCHNSTLPLQGESK